MKRLVLSAALFMSGCVVDRSYRASDDSVEAAYDNEQYVMGATPVPVTIQDAYPNTMQELLGDGFVVRRSDVAAGLLEVERLAPSKVEDFVREFKLVISFSARGAMIVPSVKRCSARDGCSTAAGLIESEARVLRKLMKFLDPQPVPIAPRNTSSL